MKKNYTLNISISPAHFWKVFLPILFGGIIVGGIIGVFIMDRVIMPRIPGISNKGMVEVPMLVNSKYDAARDMLYKIGLRLDVSSREYNDKVSKDFILLQDPPSGEKVKKGRYINVVLSKGPEITVVPELNKLNEYSARNQLRDAGFSNVVVKREYSERVEKECVTRSEPVQGSTTSREAPITIFLSRGAKPTHAVVPNIIGEVLSNAKSIIEDNGLVTGKIEYRKNNRSEPGLIISQSQPPGARVSFGSKIDLTISIR